MIEGVGSSPQISVVVPVRNGAHCVGALLRSLQAQTVSREQFEVIVVDNASTDATAQIAASYDVKVVREPIANRARARNRGVAEARSGLYAFTDADCVADPGWLKAMIACADQAALVAGEVRLHISERPNPVERFEALWRFGQKWWVEQGWAATANLLVQADAFEAIGGFDPTWRHIGEDVDFCVRARQSGFRIGYCANAIIDHEGERQLGPMLRRCFLHGYSVNQTFYRLRLGSRAWCDPMPALIGDGALREFGHSPRDFDAREWRAMARLARLGYGARVVGSIWAELMHAR